MARLTIVSDGNYQCRYVGSKEWMLRYIGRETGVCTKLTHFQIEDKCICLQSSHPISLLIRSFVHNRSPTNIVGSVMSIIAKARSCICCPPGSLKCGIMPGGGVKAPILA